MALGRHGIVFTLMAIVIAAVIVLSFENFSTPAITDKDPVLLRVQIVDRTTESFFDYLENVMVLSVQDSLTNMSRILATADGDDMSTSGYYTQNQFDAHLPGCLFTNDYSIQGTICMEDSLPDLLTIYADLVKENLNVDMEFAFDTSSFTLIQTTPFVLLAEVDVAVNVSDVMANWTINETVRVQVPTKRILDPVTAKFDDATTYSESYFQPYYFEKHSILFNLSQVKSFITNRTFVAAPNIGPSVLQRFVGDFTPDPNGIEALIDGSELKGTGWTDSETNFLNPSNFSFIDHELFNPGSGAGFSPPVFKCSGSGSELTYALPGTESIFWMNASSLSRYYGEGDFVTCD